MYCLLVVILALRGPELKNSKTGIRVFLVFQVLEGFVALLMLQTLLSLRPDRRAQRRKPKVRTPTIRGSPVARLVCF